MPAKLLHAEEVPAKPVEIEGAKNVSVRWLISKDDQAPTFAMRQFLLGAGGHTPRHSHDWEHEVYILEGSGRLHIGNSARAVSPGMVAFIPGGEVHQFVADEEGDLSFLCLIPNSGK